MKIFFLMMTYFLLSTSAHAQENCPNHCLSKELFEIHQPSEEKIKNSLENSASLQEIIYSPEKLNNLGLDQALLANEIRFISHRTADYFKFISQAKGAIVIGVVYYPGYPDAFQFKNASSNDFLKRYNQDIKKNSHCNSFHYCGLLSYEEIFYSDEKDYQFNKIDYAKFMDKTQYSGPFYFPFNSNPEELTPTKIYLVIGVNGHLVKKQELERFIK